MSELCEGHDMTRQAVTKHLALLKAADLIVTRQRGHEKLHTIQDIADRWIGKYESTRLRAC